MRLGNLKEALNISGLEDLHSVCFPDGRKKHGFGDVLKELEEFIGHTQGVLTFLPCLLQEVMQSGVHLIHQLIDPLRFKLRSHP